MKFLPEFQPIMRVERDWHRAKRADVCPPTRLFQDLRAKRDSKLTYLTA
jgi:hypothetical protein